ncbi:MAG: hypothetical protein ABH851_05160 [Methanobacteriota archaeon]
MKKPGHKIEIMLFSTIIIFIVVVSVFSVIAVIFGSNVSFDEPVESTTTSITETATTSTSTSTILVEGNSEVTSTSMIKILETPSLSILLPEGAFYLDDDVEIIVYAQEIPVSGASVYMDGSGGYLTDDSGLAVFNSVSGGDHEITAEKEGYGSAMHIFNVYPLRFGLSPAVKLRQTTGEREAAIGEGKVVFRFYDRPNCAFCMRMRPWAADIVGENRDCVSYELLSILDAGNLDEVKDLFPDSNFAETPVIVIEGPSGRFVSEGLLSKNELLDRIKSASDGRCRIR